MSVWRVVKMASTTEKTYPSVKHQSDPNLPFSMSVSVSPDFLKAFSDLFFHWHTKKFLGTKYQVSALSKKYQLKSYTVSVKLCHPPASVLYLSKHNSLFILYLAPSISTVSRFPHSSSSSSALFQVLVWHTRTEKPHLANEPKHRKDTVVIEVWEEELSSGSKSRSWLWLFIISWLGLTTAPCFLSLWGWYNLFTVDTDSEELHDSRLLAVRQTCFVRTGQHWICLFYKLGWLGLFISSIHGLLMWKTEV